MPETFYKTALLIKVGDFHLSPYISLLKKKKNLVVCFMLALVPVSSAILPFQCYTLCHKPFLSPPNVLSSDADS